MLFIMRVRMFAVRVSIMRVRMRMFVVRMRVFIMRVAVSVSVSAGVLQTLPARHEQPQSDAEDEQSAEGAQGGE